MTTIGFLSQMNLKYTELYQVIRAGIITVISLMNLWLDFEALYLMF